MQDWNYVHTNDFEITLEIGCYKYPPHDQLDKYWEENLEALLVYIERVHSGIKGFVLDENGSPVANATIEVSGIRHPIKAGPGGDYYRLLSPGDYRISVSHVGYQRITVPVKVPHGIVDPQTGTLSARVENFTLAADHSDEWSRDNDFHIEENLATAYLSNSKLEETLANFENEYPKLAHVLLNDADWSNSVPAIHLKDDSEGDEASKARIALFGGVYGSQPVGREMLIRLIRHLGQGHKKRDPEIISLFSQIELYVLPMVDVGAFDSTIEGQCSYDRERQMSYEIGSKMYSRGAPIEVRAMRRFLANYQLDAGLSIESEGKFVRIPWDDETRASYSVATKDEEDNLQVLARTLLSKQSNNATCKNQPGGDADSPKGIVRGSQLDGKYQGTLLDFAYEKFGFPLLALHVSCCDFPSRHELPYLWRENLGPIKGFLTSAAQGVHGQVSDINGNPLTNAKVVLNGKRVVSLSKKDAKFRLLLSEGNYVAKLSLDNYESKKVKFEVRKGERIRKNIVMDQITREGLKYRTFGETSEYMLSLAEKYPREARMYSVGKTPGNREINVLEMSHDVSSKSSHSKPAIAIIAGLHGNELVGAEIGLALAEFLLSHYELDDDIKSILSTYTVHLLPVVNGDGSELVSQGDCSAKVGLFNTVGVDLENDFGHNNNPQPETRALIRWFGQKPFLLSLNLRGHDENVTIPQKFGKDRTR